VPDTDASWLGERLRDTCQASLDQRAAIICIFADLGPSFRVTRAVLNVLARIVGG
jgi:hypothetical protein